MKINLRAIFIVILLTGFTLEMTMVLSRDFRNYHKDNWEAYLQKLEKEEGKDRAMSARKAHLEYEADMASDNRSWPQGKCLFCRTNDDFGPYTIGNVQFESDRFICVLCDRCWSNSTPAQRVDALEQIMLGYCDSEHWPRSQRLKVLEAFLKKEMTPIADTSDDIVWSGGFTQTGVIKLDPAHPPKHYDTSHWEDGMIEVVISDSGDVITTDLETHQSITNHAHHLDDKTPKPK